MSSSGEYVWYMSYGSNLSEERFLCYIRGWTPPGSSKRNIGCRDTTLPIKDAPIIVDRPLLFALKSSGWNDGGVCFLGEKIEDNLPTWWRMYLITKEQFIEVVEQENGNSHDIGIDLDTARETGCHIFREKSWYGKVLFLWEKDDYPIFTFTHPDADSLTPNTPDMSYIKTIARWIQEAHRAKSLEEIIGYFLKKPGIQNYLDQEELQEMLSSS